jgi:hypothetical protein
MMIPIRSAFVRPPNIFPLALLLSILDPISVLCVFVRIYGISHAGRGDVNTVEVSDEP